MNNLNFGDAIAALKEGKKVSRTNWNGKRMYLFFQRGRIACESIELSAEDTTATFADNESVISNIDGVNISIFDSDENVQCDVMPFIIMKSASGRNVIGWLASQTDMLAEDWGIIE